MNSLKFLNDRLAAEQNQILTTRDHVREAKSRLSFDPTDYNRAPSLTRIGVISAISAAAAAVIIILAWPRPAVIELNGHPNITGKWISAPNQNDRTLNFSDGSTLTLKPSSSLRVQSLKAEGARIQLEHGTLRAHVQHLSHTRWKIDAGPYLIHVTGTEFDVEWNPQSETFALFLEKGSVNVDGPMLDQTKKLTTGARMRASVADHWVEIEDENRIRTVIRRSQEVSPKEKVEEQEENTVETLSQTEPLISKDSIENIDAIKGRGKEPRPPRKSASITWQDLAAKGAYDDALKTAQLKGIDKIARTASPEDLMVLGDAARRAGSRTVAKKIYRAVHSRFPSSSHGASAAFGLGIIAFDREGHFREAAVWFESCISSGLAGELTRPAMGRLVEARYRAGDLPQARQSAKQYLKRYPGGPHAKVAKKVLESQ